MKNIKYDLTGKRFGRLLVSDTNEIKKYSYISRKTGKKVNATARYWLCKCDCGNDYWAKSSYLLLGSVVSCGCFWKENYKLPSGRSSQNTIYKTYINGAKKRNLFFQITFEEFLDISQKDCYFCGAKPSNKSQNKGSNGCFVYNGIDRLDNSKGYEKDNIVPCCCLCNKMKRDTSEKDFIKHIKAIMEKRKNDNID